MALPSFVVRVAHPCLARGSLRLVALFACVGCAIDGASRDAPAPAAAVDLVDPSPGVPARGYEPAVVSLAVAGSPRCAGALVASDVVVTARHCVSALRATVACPDGGGIAEPLAAGAIVVRVGDDAATATERARARAVIAADSDDLCGADVAFVLLDEAIDDVVPLAIHATGAATGDRVRTVGFERLRATAGAPRRESPIKVLRDHVPVEGTSSLELRLDEPPAGTGAGGPALDEASGDIVGVASRAETSDRPPGVVYERIDAFLPLFEAAMAESAFGPPGPQAHGLKSHKAPADLGASCVRGADCAAGACVEVDASRYCSRTCGPRDRCPSRYRCEHARGGRDVCIKT